MNCADAVERLSALIDGELPAEEAGAVRHHVATCDSCARRERTLEQVRAALRSAPAALVDSGGFDARVLARVRIDGAPAARYISGSWLAAAAAAALAIAVASAVLLVHDRTAPPEASTPVPAAISVPVAVSVMPVLPPVENAPGWNEGRFVVAADCGVAGPPGRCSIEDQGLLATND